MPCYSDLKTYDSKLPPIRIKAPAFFSQEFSARLNLSTIPLQQPATMYKSKVSGYSSCDSGYATLDTSQQNSCNSCN